MREECKDCNRSLEDCTCIEDTIELPNQALIEAAERLKGKELFKESNDRARQILSEIKSLPIQERYEKYSERFDNDESAIGNPETWGRRLVEDKQETLEEVAENYKINIIKSGRSHRVEYTKQIKLDFIAGAKWQQERSYSEEDIRKAYFEGVKSTGEGWNAEYANYNDPNVEEVWKQEFKDWFEQFKKK